MEKESLFLTCLIAFAAVMFLLSLLAFVIRLITEIFADPKSTSDPAVIAAISTVVTTAIPGARVVKVEEQKTGKS